MKSQMLGKNILKAEIANISQNGIWLLTGDREYFLSFKNYPWFKNAKIAEIYNVKLHHGHHLHWPDLDVDLELESLESPEKYPLIYQ